MKVIIISGRSGSGKSSCLHLLEDLGYYCVDNVPVALIPQLITHLQEGVNKVAISIDVRNIPENEETINEIIDALKKQEAEPEIFYLDAEDHALLKRYTETRRKHPLTNQQRSLTEAIAEEKKLLLPIAHLADLKIDTTDYNLYELREAISVRLNEHDKQFSLLIQSFGFKYGVPIDSDYVFDIRCLPNPHWHQELRPYNGLEQPIINFLEKFEDVEQYFQDLTQFLDTWIPKFKACNRSYMTISVGCTGGRHRSVYLVNRLYNHYLQHRQNVQIRHREL